MKSGNVQDIGQTWVTFSPGSDPYGFSRDGQWHHIAIPMADLAADLEFADMRQLFQVLGLGEVSDLSIDNIYLPVATVERNAKRCAGKKAGTNACPCVARSTAGKRQAAIQPRLTTYVRLGADRLPQNFRSR